MDLSSATCTPTTQLYSLRKLRRHCISEGNTAYLKNYVAAFFCRSGMTMENVATETGSLISLMMESQSGRGQVAALDPKDKGSRDIPVIRMLWPAGIFGSG